MARLFRSRFFRRPANATGKKRLTVIILPQLSRRGRRDQSADLFPRSEHRFCPDLKITDDQPPKITISGIS